MSSTRQSVSPGHCVVIGGGIAGLASAVWLTEAGVQVTLLERRGTLGGRTHAITVPQVGGDVADNGQHVMVAAFTNLYRYLDSIGTRHYMRLGEPFASILPGGKAQTMAAGGFGALRIAAGALNGVARKDRLRVVRAQTRLAWNLFRPPEDMDDISVDEWFRRVGMPESARRAMWDGLAIGILNEKTQLASARALRDTFAAGIRQGGRTGHTFGYATVDFDTLFVDGARRALKDQGSTIRHRAVVRRINIEGGSVTGVTLADGEQIDADAVVCAVPAWGIKGLLDDVPGHDRIYAAAGRLEAVPIVSVNLYLDRPLGTASWADNLIGAEGEVEVVFDRQRMHGRSTEDGWLYALTTSAAYDLSAKSGAEIAELCMEVLRRYYPEARDAKLVHPHIVRMNTATFTQRPGTAGIRPTQATEVAGLVLAGDWTQTGWPSTMESAAQSAAQAVDVLLGHPRPS